MASLDAVTLLSLHCQQTRKSIPHCIRLLPENRPRSREEALARRIVWPEEPSSYLDHNGGYMYETRPLALTLEDIKEQKRRRQQNIRDKMGVLKKLMGETDDEHKPVLMDIESMKRRMARAHRKRALAYMIRKHL